MADHLSVDLRVQPRRRLTLRVTAPGGLILVVAALAIGHGVPARTIPHPLRSPTMASAAHPQATGVRGASRCAP